jgi:hypothetical protein
MLCSAPIPTLGTLILDVGPPPFCDVYFTDGSPIENISMNELLNWLSLLLLAQWFFGNLYEAVAFVPNLVSLFELTNATGEALFRSKRRSPVAYYLPSVALVAPITITLAVISIRDHAPGADFLVATCVLLFVGVGITFYTVLKVNLDLFFKPQVDLTRTRKLLLTWTVLNFVRLPAAAASLVTTILWIRTNFRC